MVQCQSIPGSLIHSYENRLAEGGGAKCSFNKWLSFALKWHLPGSKVCINKQETVDRYLMPV